MDVTLAKPNSADSDLVDLRRLGVSYWMVAIDTLKMLADLRAEREQIEQAIITIERLAAGSRGKRRGRPPAWMAGVDKKATVAGAVPGKKRTVSAAARKRMADAMKKRWAAKKAQTSKAESNT